jgi:penicillin-binding protein 2
MQRSKKQEQRIITNRGKFLIIFCAFLCLILFSRLIFLQVIDKEKFTTMRTKNVVKTSYILPERGDILDRENRKIAGTRGMFSVVVVPEKIKGFRKNREQVSNDFIEKISEIIELTEKQKTKLKRTLKHSPIFSEVVIKSDIEEEELTAITQNKKYLEGVDITSSRVRNYENGSYYLNVLGYVGKVSPKDLKDETKFLTNLDYVGKQGVEKLKDKELLGKHGEEVIGINAYGKAMSRDKLKESQKGETIHLTIDQDLQILAHELLGEERGSVVALDPNTGEVLAMASTPTYDPNKLVKGLSHEEYNRIFKSVNTSPFFDRAIMGQYPPASTIKPFVSIAGLLGDWIDPEKRVWCGPYYQLKGSTRRFNDWKPQGHGWLTMTDAIARSADVYYYKLGKEMGIDYLHDVMSVYGFDKKTGIDLKGEKSGILPSTEWKKKRLKESWYTGETLIASIGQGYMLSTPLQLAQATAVLVNGGKTYKPKLIMEDETKLISEVNIPEEYTEIAKAGMREVLFGEYGTARKWKRKLIRYNQGGKTGTSQVYSTKGERPDKDVEMPKHLKDHALYIGFAPYDDPKIVISVVVENIGGGSTYAAPIGIKVMQKYLDKNYPELIMEGKEVLKEENKNEKK